MIRDIYHPTMSKIWLGNRSTCQIVYGQRFQSNYHPTSNNTLSNTQESSSQEQQKTPTKKHTKTRTLPIGLLYFLLHFLHFLERTKLVTLKNTKENQRSESTWATYGWGLLDNPANVFSLGDMSGFTNQQKKQIQHPGNSAKEKKVTFLEDDDEFDPPKIKGCLYLKDPDMS